MNVVLIIPSQKYIFAMRNAQTMRFYLKTIYILLGLFLFSFTTPAQERATAQNGEGIDHFLQRHNRKGREYKKAFLQLNKNKFGKDNSLLLDVKYKLPPLKGDTVEEEKPINKKMSPQLLSEVKEEEEKDIKYEKSRKGFEPLFGKAYARVQPSSQILRGACFYLVSGHGGPDPGAIGYLGNNELHEDEYAYDIMLRLARNLMSRGAIVHIIIQDAHDGIRDEQILENSKRETCMGEAIPFNQVQRLEQRCTKINGLNLRDPGSYHRAIFIHIDSRSETERTDVFFYHQDNNAKSQKLAETMQNTFAQKYGASQPGRGFTGTASSRNLYVMRHSNPVSVFVELGNLQNSEDQQRLILSNNRQALANWLAEGFVIDHSQYAKQSKEKSTKSIKSSKKSTRKSESKVTQSSKKQKKASTKTTSKKKSATNKEKQKK